MEAPGAPRARICCGASRARPCGVPDAGVGRVGAHAQGRLRSRGARSARHIQQPAHPQEGVEGCGRVWRRGGVRRGSGGGECARSPPLCDALLDQVLQRLPCLLGGLGRGAHRALKVQIHLQGRVLGAAGCDKGRCGQCWQELDVQGGGPERAGHASTPQTSPPGCRYTHTHPPCLSCVSPASTLPHMSTAFTLRSPCPA